MTIDKAQILAARRRFEDVEVPEWGGSVRLWEMSAAAHLAYVAVESPVDLRARVLAATIGDEEGVLLFSPAEAAELAARSSSALIGRLFTRALAVSGLGEADPAGE